MSTHCIHKVTLQNKTVIQIRITARILVDCGNINLVLKIRLLVVHLKMCRPIIIVPTRMTVPGHCKIQTKPFTFNDSDSCYSKNSRLK